MNSSCCRPAIVRAASAASSSSLLVGSSTNARQRLLNAQIRSQQRIPSQSVIRTKRTSAKNNNKSNKAAVSRALRSNSSNSNSSSSSGQGIFGLEPVNYATAPTPGICASPPPPPPKPGLAKYTFPISALLTMGVTAYFYVNNQNDSFAYWESMQTGGIPKDDDDDDDDLDEGEEEE